MAGRDFAYSNAVADYFDRCAEEGMFNEFSAGELPVVKGLLEEMDLGAGEKVVEPGCGAGRLTELLAEMVGPKGNVLAFDISPRMVEKCLARNLPHQVEVVLARASKLPVSEEEFDEVVCVNTFPHFENPLAVLGEFRRIVREAGILWIAHTHSREWVNSLHSSIGGVLANHLLPTEREFERLLGETGFRLQFLRDLPDRYLLKAIRACCREQKEL